MDADLTGVSPWSLGLVAALGYALGSIPFGLLLTHWAGAGDIRAIGSGNIGATNVLRTGRKSLALATLLLDLAKGAVPAVLGHLWLGPAGAVLGGAGAVPRPCGPVLLGVRGRQGLAAPAGDGGEAPQDLAELMLGAFVLVVAFTRWVSLGSIMAACIAPVAAWVSGNSWAGGLYLLIAALIVWKHRENIGRLVRGEESRITFQAKSSS